MTDWRDARLPPRRVIKEGATHTRKAQKVFIVALLALSVLGGGLACAQGAQTTAANNVHQAFALTTSETAVYTNPSGAFEPIPSTSQTVNLDSDSLLVITFSARGEVQPSGTQLIPIVFVRCEIDGVGCQPDAGGVEFLYPQFCCDTRSFTWVVHNASAGAHDIRILWGMGNPTAAYIGNRTLIMEAAKALRQTDPAVRTGRPHIDD